MRVDGAASDVELLATMEALGKRAAVVTHTRGVKAPPTAGTGTPAAASRSQVTCLSLAAMT